MHKNKGQTDASRLRLLENYLCSPLSAYQFGRENRLFYGATRSWLRIFDIEDKARCQEMKKQEKSEVDISRLIHHSDRGIQYASNEYTNLLKTNQIQISMTQDGAPLLIKN